MMNYLEEEKKRTISSRFHLSIYILSRTIHFKNNYIVGDTDNFRYLEEEDR